MLYFLCRNGAFNFVFFISPYLSHFSENFKAAYTNISILTFYECLTEIGPVQSIAYLIKKDRLHSHSSPSLSSNAFG